MSQELLQQYGILLIIVGLVLVVLLLLLLFLRRRSATKKGLRPAAAAIAELADDALGSDEPQMEITIAEEADEQSQTEGGFQLFKKKKSKTSKKKASSGNTKVADEELVARLEDLEQQMLALRELFRAGDITRSVYIAETKALYDIAQTLR